MSNYYLTILVLVDNKKNIPFLKNKVEIKDYSLCYECYYSEQLIKLINNYKIPHKIINVDLNNKDLYLSNKINSYPQIYLKKKKTLGNLLIGGYNEFLTFVNIFSKKYSDIDLNNFMFKNKFSKKVILRLIELINISKIK
jgi:hypothetical protein